MFNPKKEINDETDYELYAIDMFSEFLESFTEEEGLIREPQEDDGFDEGDVGYVYTDKGQVLAEKMLRRLTEIGNKYFPNNTISIQTSAFREP